MTLWKWVFFGVFSTLLVACGGGGSSSQSTITSVTTVPEFAVIKDDGIKSSSSSVAGNGSIVFAEPLGDVESAFKIKFELVDENSAITLFVFSDSKLSESSAVVIKIQKMNGNLTGTFKISGSEPIPLGFEVIPETENSFYVDVHNDEEPTHVLIWKVDTILFDEPSTVFNSNTNALKAALGQKKGTGAFFGVKLENASLQSLSFHTSKFVD
jgi:hypothetical protein